MPKNRYHIHIVCADDDELLFLDSLAIFFQSRAFLTYDVSSKLPKASLYGRQCIDDCDYVILIIGDSYGTTHRSGVSQMHLSYLSAKAKMKPLLKLVKVHNDDSRVSRQLQEFTRVVEKKAQNLYFYDVETDIDQLLTQAYGALTTKYDIKKSWSKAGEESLQRNQRTFSNTYTSSPSANSSPANSSSTNSTVIQTKPNPSQSATARPSAIVAPPAQPAYISANRVAEDSYQLTQPITLSDSLSIQYSAQAYEGGNLSDVTLITVVTWLEVLSILVRMPATFSSYGLQSGINRLIASKAEAEIKADMPNVHAIARCQIAQKDLNELQRQLIAANWIELSTFGARVSQELWKLTFHGKSIYKNSQIDANSTAQ